MARTLLLNQAQTRQALGFDALLAAVRTALIATSQGQTSTPPRIAALGPSGLLGAMPGYVAGLGLAGKLVAVFPTAPGRSAHRGIVALFDDTTGQLSAIVDAEAITAARTAAAATVAFEALCPPAPSQITIIGAGTQARAQLAMLRHLDVTAQLVVAACDPLAAATLAERHQAHPTSAIEDAVAGADAVFCCTDADEPVIAHRWLAPHAHVSSVGGSRGPELDPETVASGRLFVEWPGAVTCPPPAGAHELQGVPAERATLVGAVLAGTAPGRTGGELTVYKATGYAALDVAAAAVAYEHARAHGFGTWVNL